MGRLVVHIGTGKTGSSAIQWFLKRNRELLANQGVCYPTFPVLAKLDSNATFLQQLGWARSGLAPRAIGPAVAADCMAKLAEALSTHETTVLSDEHLSMIGWKGVPRNDKSFRLFWKSIASVLEETGADSVLAILYLRRQDELLASSWKQTVRGNKMFSPFRKFARSPGNRFRTRYSSIVDIILEALGPVHGQVCLRRYDPVRFVGESIYTDFFDAANIAFPEEAVLPDGLVNKSLTFDMTEAVRRLRKRVEISAPTWLDQLQPIAVRLCEEEPDPARLTPFLPLETRLLLARHAAGNRRLGRLIGDGEPLFSNDCDAPVWKPDEQRINRYIEELRAAL